MEAFGKESYKKLEKCLRAEKYATAIANQTLPERRWHHVFCAPTWELPESSVTKPLVLIARPGRYKMTVSATNRNICITVPIQLTNSSTKPTSSSDIEEIRRIRSSIIENVLGDRMGFTLGGDGSKFGLVALARPGAYFCQRVGDKELRIFMSLEDEQDPISALYVPRGAAAPRSVASSSYGSSYYSAASRRESWGSSGRSYARCDAARFH